MDKSSKLTKYNAQQVAAALKAARGNITLAAQALGSTRQTIYNYIYRHPSVRDILDESRELMIDNVESVLYKKALEGEAWAVCFFLKTQAKHRGYVERVQQDLSGGVQLTVVYSNPPQVDADDV